MNYGDTRSESMYCLDNLKREEKINQVIDK